MSDKYMGTLVPHPQSRTHLNQSPINENEVACLQVHRLALVLEPSGQV